MLIILKADFFQNAVVISIRYSSSWKHDAIFHIIDQNKISSYQYELRTEEHLKLHQK